MAPSLTAVRTWKPDGGHVSIPAGHWDNTAN